jgi:hypothetical protein
MKLVQSNERQVTIEGSAAKVTIRPVSEDMRRGWYVIWYLQHSFVTSVQGQAFMNDSDLESAFGLSDEYNPSGNQWLIDQYGGDCAHQGRYIRYKDHVNIPCPGTTHDGDPNVSIALDEAIKKAVRELLDHSATLSK